jgi:putative membrane protein
MSTLLPFLSTLFIVISAILVAVGWYLIVKGKRDSHQKVMVAAALFAILFFVIYASRTFIVGNTEFGGPDDIKLFYTVFLIFHILLATVGAVFGIITLTLAYKGNFFKHRKIGPWTAVIWFLTAITGVMVYYLLYIKYPGGEVTNVVRAIFG